MRYRRPQSVTILKDGRPVRFEYDEVDHCCRNFNLLDEWLDAKGLQQRGTVGRAGARLARARDVVDVAIQHLRENETVFLHPAGSCRECDEARSSI